MAKVTSGRGEIIVGSDYAGVFIGSTFAQEFRTTFLASPEVSVRLGILPNHLPFVGILHDTT